jgi:hypothetical protein
MSRARRSVPSRSIGEVATTQSCKSANRNLENMAVQQLRMRWQWDAALRSRPARWVAAPLSAHRDAPVACFVNAVHNADGSFRPVPRPPKHARALSRPRLPGSFG